MITVNEVMSPNPICITEDESLAKAGEIFSQNHFHHLPVVDKNNHLKGILNNTDFERALHGDTLFKLEDKDKYNSLILKTKLIRNSMKSEVITINYDKPLKEAYLLLKSNNFRCLPVLDDNKLVGIITNRDLVDYFMGNHEGSIHK